MFEIDGLVNRIGALATGHTLSVVSVKKYYNDRGDPDTIEDEYPIDGIVQISTADDDVVKEGILFPMDLICFFDEQVVNSDKLVVQNKLKYDGKKYVITQVIRELGHTEVLAKKL
jgi:hypothetical protein